jgi:hypothetical protein
MMGFATVYVFGRYLQKEGKWFYVKTLGEGILCEVVLVLELVLCMLRRGWALALGNQLDPMQVKELLVCPCISALILF